MATTDDQSAPPASPAPSGGGAPQPPEKTWEQLFLGNALAEVSIYEPTPPANFDRKPVKLYGINHGEIGWDLVGVAGTTARDQTHGSAEPQPEHRLTDKERADLDAEIEAYHATVPGVIKGMEELIAASEKSRDAPDADRKNWQHTIDDARTALADVKQSHKEWQQQKAAARQAKIAEDNQPKDQDGNPLPEAAPAAPSPDDHRADMHGTTGINGGDLTRDSRSQAVDVEHPNLAPKTSMQEREDEYLKAVTGKMDVGDTRDQKAETERIKASEKSEHDKIEAIIGKMDVGDAPSQKAEKARMDANGQAEDSRIAWHKYHEDVEVAKTTSSPPPDPPPGEDPTAPQQASDQAAEPEHVSRAHAAHMAREEAKHEAHDQREAERVEIHSGHHQQDEHEAAREERDEDHDAKAEERSQRHSGHAHQDAREAARAEKDGARDEQREQREEQHSGHARHDQHEAARQQKQEARAQRRGLQTPGGVAVHVAANRLQQTSKDKPASAQDWRYFSP